MKNERRSRSRSRSRSPLNNERRSRSRSPRRSRNISTKRCIISNIPYDLKWQEIKDLFRNEVGDVMYVELFNNPDGKPKGTGVIEFRDVETAQLAIDKMHRFEIKDRKLVVREERERDRRQNEMSGRGGGGGGGGGGGRDGPGVMGPAPRNMGMGGGGGMNAGMGSMGAGMGGGGMGNQGVSPQILQQLGIEGPLSNIVFVSNLDYKVGWKKLKDVFKLAGKVVRSEIKEDKDGKSRGMGTVMFETPMEAVQAISMFNNQNLYERIMRVKMDGQQSSARRPEPLPTGLGSLGPSLTNLQQMGSGMSEMGGGMGMGGMGAGSGMGMSGMTGGMGSMDRGMGSGMGSGLSGMGGMGSMGGMSSGMGGMMGSGMGSSLSGGMGSMGAGMSGMGMGDTFSSGMGSMSGMGSGEMGGGSMGSSGLSDSFGMSSMGGMNMGASSGFSSMMDGGRSSGMGNYGSNSGGMSSRTDYGRDSGRSSSAMAGGGDMKTRADKSTVIVKNLPYSLDWQTLKSKFQSVGDIRFAEISKNDKGRSNGWGLVSFRREEDAQVAVQRMNRVNVEGRDIVVKLLN